MKINAIESKREKLKPSLLHRNSKKKKMTNVITVIFIGEFL